MKKVLVTGFTRGIGKAITEKLISEDYFVYGVYKSSDTAAKDMQKDLKNIEYYKSDLSDRKQTLELVEKLKNEKFDGIVNNAGIIEFESFDEIDYKNWDRVFEVNLNAPFILSSGLKSSLVKGSVIVNIASTDGMTGSFVSMSYSASKAALINLTKSLGNVYGNRGIRVVSLAPGWVGSGMDSPAVKEAMENNPLGRNAEFNEIANVVSFLFSDKASFINGQTIIVDGGYTNVDPILKREAQAVEKTVK